MVVVDVVLAVANHVSSMLLFAFGLFNLYPPMLVSIPPLCLCLCTIIFLSPLTVSPTWFWVRQSCETPRGCHCVVLCANRPKVFVPWPRCHYVVYVCCASPSSSLFLSVFLCASFPSIRPSLPTSFHSSFLFGSCIPDSPPPYM